jgi:hypothetical protein
MAVDPATNLPRGLVVIDQMRNTQDKGESECPVRGAPGNRIIDWHGYMPQIWVAATIDE